jgi:hypothetical protein
MSMRSRSARFVAVAVLALAAAACTKTLDTDGLEGDLKSQIEDQTDSTITSVDCPPDIEAKAGGTFECTAEEGSGATFTIRVTQRDDAGRVDWEIIDASA